MTTRHYLAMGLILGCLSGVFSQGCWADDTIHWFTVNYPPVYFVEGERQGEGFCDVAGEQFRQALTGYHHQLIADASLLRILEYWKKTDATYCIPGLGVTARQFPHTVYSKAMSIVPPVGIMIRKAERDRFVTLKEKQASLERLLHDPTLVCGVFAEGQYGKRIDALIKRYKGKPQLYERPNIDNVALFRMVAHKRVDYAPTYPITVKIALEALPYDERDALQFLPLIEADATKTAHAVCNDTPLGRQVIEQIDQVLATETYKIVVTERLLEFLPENLRTEYRLLSFQYIGQ